MHHKSKSTCPGRRLSRRRFLGSLGLATAGLHVPGFGIGKAFAQLGFGARSTVTTAHLASYERPLIRAAVESMIAGLGGLSDIISVGDRVGIKINLTGGYQSARDYEVQTGMHPGETYWTHPEILRAVGELILDAGASDIFVMEAVYDWESYANYGYKSVADYLGATFVDLNQTAPYAGYATRAVGQNAFIYPSLIQNGTLDNIDCLVSLAKSKRHNGAGVTHGMKNLVGTLPMPPGIYNAGQSYRAAIHSHTSYEGNTYSNLRRVIMDINGATPIQLVVNDAIRTVLGGEGPWGTITPAPFETLVASKDPVAADVIGTQVIGFDPMSTNGSHPFPDGLNYLRLANTLGMGEYDLANIDVVDVTGTAVETGPETGIELSLSNYPNPFSSSTTFQFTLDRSAFVSILVYDLRGRLINRLVSESRPSGLHRVDWNVNQNSGSRLSTGVYVAVLRVDDRSTSHKITLLR